MAATIQISDGTTTCDLTGSTGDYALMYDSWAPKVAKRRQGLLGGSPYEDVEEVMQIKVKGTTVSDLLGNLTTLTNLLDQANAWGMGENVNDVSISYKHDGSSTTVSAVIWGAEVITPPDFTRAGVNEFLLMPVTLRFLRRGLWLGGTETETQTTGTGNPIILTSSTFTDTASILWPYNAQLDFSAIPDALIDHDGFYVAFSDAADKLKLLEAESLTDTNMTSTVVTGSSGGSVMRTDTGQTSFRLQMLLTSAGDGALNSSIRDVELFMMARNNSSTISYTATAYLVGISGYGRSVSIDTSSTNPRLINLGLFHSPVQYDEVAGTSAGATLFVDMTSDASVTTGNTLDVDYFVLIGWDDSTRLVRFNAETREQRWKIDHQLNSKISPVAYVTDTSNNYESPGNTEGDLLLMASGNVISVIIFGPHDGDFTVQDSADNELDVDLSVTRTKAYLTPP